VNLTTSLMVNRFVVAYARNPLDQAVGKLDGKRQFGFAGRNRPFQLLRLFEVAVGLTRRNGAVACQPLDYLGQLIDLLEQDPCAIEALGLLDIVGTRHLS
jgi:hypothetical protein